MHSKASPMHLEGFRSPNTDPTIYVFLAPPPTNLHPSAKRKNLAFPLRMAVLSDCGGALRGPLAASPARCLARQPRSLQPGPPQYYRAAALRSGASPRSSAVRSSAARFLERPCGVRPGWRGEAPRGPSKKSQFPRTSRKLSLRIAMFGCLARAARSPARCLARQPRSLQPGPRQAPMPSYTHPPIRQLGPGDHEFSGSHWGP
jgi:hypothetical protein